MGTDAISKSSNNIISNAKNTRKAYDKMWRVAAHAPVFCKITKKQVADGKGKPKYKKFYRTSRLIGSHAYNIAASGAAMRAACIMMDDAHTLRLEAGSESKRAPWFPGVQKGAKMLLEQFLCALAQEATYKGHVVRQCCRTTRLSSKQVRLGWESTFESVFGSSSIIPRKIIAIPLDKKNASGKKKKKSDNDKKSERGANPSADDDDEYDDAEGNTEDLQPEDP
tara:strand:- start:6203 stop:6874 length:672 start_codon:yes stop_codon:yes gene_type:complete